MDTNDQYGGHPRTPRRQPARLGSARLGGAPLGSAPLGSAPLGRPRLRRPRLRETRLVVAAGAAALALSAGLATPLGPAAQQAHAADGDGKVLTVAVAQSVDSLSPFLAVRLLSTSIHRLTYEYLTNYDPEDNSVVPGFATKWESSPDKLTWTYTIRSDSKWSDGEQATAEDAAWTFNTMMTDSGAATANGSFVSNFETVTAPSPTQLVVKLKKPQATMTALDVPIVPKHVWEKVDDFSKFNNDKDFPVVGNGPFVLTDYKPDSYVRLKANRDFWRGAPEFDELVFRYYKDQDAAVSALRKGEVSFVAGSPSLTPAQAAALKGEENIHVNDAPGRRFYALATNPGARAKNGETMGDGHPSLLDQRVRNALFKAVDRKTIIDKVFQGHAVEGAGYVPPRFSQYFWKPSPGQELTYDPEEAGRMLDRAGLRRNEDGRRVGEEGKPITYRVLCHATDPNDKAIGQYLQEWWGELGIGVTLNCLDNVTDPWLAGEYDPDRRAAIVRQMESRLYDLGYMNVMAYPNAVEAYRTDQIESITTMPAKAGNIYGQDGYWSWWSAVPAESGDTSGGSSSTGVVVGIVAGVVVLAGVGAFLAVRRRATADERE
ncbi:ABC transporter substrate-binding protein [Streptomyces althioticus]|uniref:ABC transporter substrate-binding protein n=1 Tax=Streptomyces althioticus TaxID=83380 RepID=UPI0033E74D27